MFTKLRCQFIPRFSSHSSICSYWKRGSNGQGLGMSLTLKI